MFCRAKGRRSRDEGRNGEGAMRISSTCKNSVPERIGVVMSRSLKWNLTTALMTVLTTMMFVITTNAAAEKSSMSTTTTATTVSTPTMPSTIPQQEENSTPQVDSSSSSGSSGSNVVGDDEIPKHRIGEMESSIGFYQAIELVQNSLLFSKQSKYQTIEVHQSRFYGKVLVLDGVIQLTERDADSYNEMMAHVGMFTHSKPKKVLIIGGGDGYVLKEVLKHPSVEHVDHVDLDEDVIETCETFFPWGSAWKDTRAQLHIRDGAQFVRDAADGTYDVIIQDSSDPWAVAEDGVMRPLPSGVLYEEQHFCELNRILKPDGVLVIQAESFGVPTSLGGIVVWRSIMDTCGFRRSRYGSIYTSSYPTGQIGFLLGEKDPCSAAPYRDVVDRYNQIVESGQKTSYYHPPLQKGCFEVPLWVHDNIYGTDETTDDSCSSEDMETTDE